MRNGRMGCQKTIVTKLASFGKEEYPQGEVVGKYIN